MSAEVLIKQVGNKSEEEIEETLSLSDLVINDDSEGNNTSNTSTFSINGNDSDLFEFYNQPDHHYSSPNQGFIFCGKIIHCKGHCEDGTFHARVGKHGNKTERQKSEWKAPAGVLHRSISARPWRWYLFAFGAGRFRVEMEREQMKMRQMRTQSPNRKLFPVNNANGKRGIISKRVNKGFLGWFRGLGCRDECATAVVGCAPPSQFEQRP